MRNNVPGCTDARVIAFLETLGLRPGVMVRVQAKHPFDGPMVLLVDGQGQTVGENVACQIYVRSDGDVPYEPAAARERTEQHT